MKRSRCGPFSRTILGSADVTGRCRQRVQTPFQDSCETPYEDVVGHGPLFFELPQPVLLRPMAVEKVSVWSAPHPWTGDQPPGIRLRLPNSVRGSPLKRAPASPVIGRLLPAAEEKAVRWYFLLWAVFRFHHRRSLERRGKPNGTLGNPRCRAPTAQPPHRIPDGEPPSESVAHPKVRDRRFILRVNSGGRRYTRLAVVCQDRLSPRSCKARRGVYHGRWT